jgi:hypothetical protein
VYTLERLETALLSRWGREEMTVYADYLQSIGDPRGEVIAIDLVNLDTVDETDWRTRRHDVISAWLGEDLATKLGGLIFQGFVQEAASDETLLASPAGDFVRASRLGNDLSVLARLVSRPRRWLTRLAITAEPERGPLIDAAMTDKLVAATPRLDELVLRGRGILKGLSHPNARHIRLDGAVVDSLCWRGDWMKPPPVLAIERVREPSEHADTRLYLASAETMPALDELAIQRHVTHLRFTAPATLLPRALEALPNLTVVETTATGRVFETLRALVAKHPHVTIRAIER